MLLETSPMKGWALQSSNKTLAQTLFHQYHTAATPNQHTAQWPDGNEQTSLWVSLQTSLTVQPESCVGDPGSQGVWGCG